MVQGEKKTKKKKLRIQFREERCFIPRSKIDLGGVKLLPMAEGVRCERNVFGSAVEVY